MRQEKIGQVEVKTKAKVKIEAKTESRLFSQPLFLYFTQPSFLVFPVFCYGIFFAVNYSKKFPKTSHNRIGGIRLPWSPPENRGYAH